TLVRPLFRRGVGIPDNLSAVERTTLESIRAAWEAAMHTKVIPSVKQELSPQAKRIIEAAEETTSRINSLKREFTSPVPSVVGLDAAVTNMQEIQAEFTEKIKSILELPEETSYYDLFTGKAAQLIADQGLLLLPSFEVFRAKDKSVHFLSPALFRVKAVEEASDMNVLGYLLETRIVTARPLAGEKENFESRSALGNIIIYDRPGANGNTANSPNPIGLANIENMLRSTRAMLENGILPDDPDHIFIRTAELQAAQMVLSGEYKPFWIRYEAGQLLWRMLNNMHHPVDNPVGSLKTFRESMVAGEVLAMLAALEGEPYSDSRAIMGYIAERVELVFDYREINDNMSNVAGVIVYGLMQRMVAHDPPRYGFPEKTEILAHMKRFKGYNGDGPLEDYAALHLSELGSANRWEDRQQLVRDIMRFLLPLNNK
ncbi:MAG: hypothetical protein D6719_05730, partial [Candidatus Dadabacteria bacterium]